MEGCWKLIKCEVNGRIKWKLSGKLEKCYLSGIGSNMIKLKIIKWNMMEGKQVENYWNSIKWRLERLGLLSVNCCVCILTMTITVTTEHYFNRRQHSPVWRKNDGSSAVSELGQNAPCLSLCDGVQSASRFIQEDDARLPYHRRCQTQLPLVSTTEMKATCSIWHTNLLYYLDGWRVIGYALLWLISSLRSSHSTTYFIITFLLCYIHSHSGVNCTYFIVRIQKRNVNTRKVLFNSRVSRSRYFCMSRRGLVADWPTWPALVKITLFLMSALLFHPQSFRNMSFYVVLWTCIVLYPWKCCSCKISSSFTGYHKRWHLGHVMLSRVTVEHTDSKCDFLKKIKNL